MPDLASRSLSLSFSSSSSTSRGSLLGFISLHHISRRDHLLLGELIGGGLGEVKFFWALGFGIWDSAVDLSALSASLR